MKINVWLCVAQYRPIWYAPRVVCNLTFIQDCALKDSAGAQDECPPQKIDGIGQWTWTLRIVHKRIVWCFLLSEFSIDVDGTGNGKCTDAILIMYLNILKAVQSGLSVRN